jgi:anti-sigma factor ChrR (cupin superfamily)
MSGKRAAARSGESPDDPFRPNSALFALGSLPEEEARAFEAHLLACPACAEEVRSYRDVLAEVGRLAVVPPGELRERVLDRAAREPAGASALPAQATPPAPGPGKAEDPSIPAEATQVWKRWSRPAEVQEGLRVVRGGEGGWEETAVPGVRVKPLSVDPVRRYVTMLVRMEPGSSYPPHRHGGVEECYVVEGDLHVGEDVLHGGDYQVAADDSRHPAQWTEGGCLLLIVSSQEDELLEGI